MKKTRKSGILLHPTSLPSKYQIGDLGKYAYKFIDYINDAGFSLWQILPLNPVNFANSPYATTSAISFNTLLIDPEKLKEDGLIDEIPEAYSKYGEDRVDYESAKKYKENILKTAFNNFNTDDKDFMAFCKRNPKLMENAIFNILSQKNQNEWNKWKEEYSPKLITRLKDLYKHEIMEYMFKQFIVQGQWLDLKKYANEKGIMIIGDIPIYVDYNSYDVWANPEIFHLNKRTKLPLEVSGVPPDYFSEDGQLWNNPLYKWFNREGELNMDLMKWWKLRIRNIMKFVDIIRIDHFRGFEKYWAVKRGSKTARKGKWRKGPGKSFFEKINNTLGKIDIIAEDLGVITKGVEKLRSDLGFPGMKILHFAFSDPKNPYLPSNYDDINYIVYTGTHDNNTTIGWYTEDIDNYTQDFINRYTQRHVDKENIADILIHLALSSIAKWAVFPMQDILYMDSNSRMNKPSVIENNWDWKLKIEDLERMDTDKYMNLNILYNR